MQTNLKEFIERNIDLISDYKFEDVNILAHSQIPFQIGNLTTTLMQAGINPLDHLKHVVRDMFSNSMIKVVTLPENIDFINSQGFLDCFELTTISLPESLTHIHSSAFKGCYELTTINYNGTINQWKALDIHPAVFADCAACFVHCADGDVELQTLK